jgi:integrase
VPLIDLAARGLDELSRRDDFTGAGDRVFADAFGLPLYDNAIRDGLYAALDAAGIDRDRGTGKLFVFHDLRHTFGTLAVRAWPLSDVQAYMGTRTSRRRYCTSITSRAREPLMSSARWWMRSFQRLVRYPLVTRTR